MKIDILIKSDLNPTRQEQISTLFEQLGGTKTQIDLKEVLDDKNQITLAYCEEKDAIVGIASMCIYKVISGRKGWIEDVVVDSQSRGKGIGRKLINKLLEVGKEQHLSEILLFTEDHRKAAIHLYSDLGFKLKNSKIYSLKWL
ncbi:GNAT family N-acetyltransferase [Muriicola sp. Z0-33]|uniref:GNAT family N-acetyltransferase n=1 Tax=Muriicola sp. Z0-33 TaxID=2816957 RepID=UPI0022383ED0|nr:GNAT family N-acetyltransferase [Muriicola sp. Z0-33]MCW5517467.1 GNAT family N-acetyltransferase [Muriicola sp. Z0-33]